MNEILKLWWENEAKSIFQTCITHCVEKVTDLLLFVEDCKTAVENDRQMVKDFNGDIKAIKKDMQKQNIKPLLKNREDIFIISLKHYIFDLALKAGSLENLSLSADNLAHDYAKLLAEFEELEDRFKNDDETLDVEAIEASTELVIRIKELDEQTLKIVNERLAIEEARDEVLSELESYINENTKIDVKLKVFPVEESLME